MRRRSKPLLVPKVLACTVLGVAIGGAACGPSEDPPEESIICVKQAADGGDPLDGGQCPSGTVATEEDCPAGCEAIIV